MGKTVTARASRASKPVVSTETASTETALVALAQIDMRGGASIDATTAVLNELASTGFSDAINRRQASELAHLAIAQTDAKIARSYYMRGGVGGELILANDPLAIAAAQLDNPGWVPDFNGLVLKNPPLIGTNVLAYGHHVCEKGHRAGTETAKPGMFIRNEPQHLAYGRVRTRWNAIVAPEKTPEERAAAASKAAEKRLQKKREAAAANGEAVKRGNGEWIKPETTSDLLRTALSVMNDLRAFFNDNIDFLPVVTGEWANRSCRELQELFEKHQDDDGIK